MTKRQKKMLARILVSAVLLVVAKLLPLSGAFQLMAFLVPYAVIGWDIVWKALRNIAHGQVFDENFLMTIATVGAFCTGEFPEAVVVMLFYQVGELFQGYAVGRSRESIASLMDIRPDYANIEREGKLEQVDPDEVAVGDHIVIKAGEKIPLDGVILEGSSTVNTAALTGESLYQPERFTPRPSDKRIRGVHGFEDPGFGGKFQQQEGEGRKFYHKICPLLYPGCGNCGRIAGRVAATSVRGTMGRVDSESFDILSHLLPLRAGHIGTTQLLRGNRTGLEEWDPS